MRPFFTKPEQAESATGLSGQGGWFDQISHAEGDPALPLCRSIRSRLAEAVKSRVPFVLLDDQLKGRASLFSNPVRIFEATDSAQVPETMAAVRDAVDGGATLVGFLSYGAGASFEGIELRPNPSPGARPAPLLWFAEFAEHSEGLLDDGDGMPPHVAIQPLIRRRDYEERVARAIDRIAAGDIYQVNLTFPAFLEIADPCAYYLSIRRRARAPFGAYLQLEDRNFLSFSPELFFRTDGDLIWTRPMKGTRKRGTTPAADRRIADALTASAKDRAENLMIVDLLRNDLSRVCVPGSVEVPRLFELEPYPTVWQMTSTIAGRLREGIGAVDALEALFPCGSITGAPKIMAMRVINETETFDRGIYTGSIGVLNAQQSAFNVAIRTIDHDGLNGRLDIGAGIVADSRPRSEWFECLSKARFVSA